MADEARIGWGKKVNQLRADLEKKMEDAKINLYELHKVMTPEERQSLKSWIEQVIPLETSPGPLLRGRLHVELRYPKGEDEIRVEGMPASMIKKMLDALDKGDNFEPPTWPELGMG